MSLGPESPREEQGFLGLGPPIMAVSPTPQQREYGNGSATEGRLNESEVSGTPGGFHFSEHVLDVWMHVFSLLVASLGLLGNGTVLWLLGFRIQRTPFSVYILNLAGADTLFLCCSLLLSLMNLLTCVYPITYNVVAYLQYMFYIASLNLLSAITTERCLSVLFPIWYQCLRSKHMSAKVCSGIWALAGMTEVIEFVTRNYVFPHSFCPNFFIIHFLWFLLLTCVMCVSSLTLLLRVQCSSRRRRLPRLYLLVMLTVLVFLLFGLPLGLQDFINDRFKIDFMPFSLFQSLACVNSCMNPFIYFFVGKQGHKGRESLRLVLQRALGEEQEVGGGMRDIPHTNTQETSS
ncbi:mas-related G-protein coupled receptor member X1-like [Antechinus flavipes]|uniref:mas-related G-protein coupled receptor member X1-like n=1 Tax=Antechinus flavipes TaxID=38775 RepID=UPI00223648BB|nr:mas-related G-protein coupled receptor member X1-like [Antechinus flavipes]